MQTNAIRKRVSMLLVGGLDDIVIGLNEKAHALLPGKKQMIIISGAGHLFEEPGTMEEVAERAAAWFKKHLHGSSTS
jgi:putative phosphoribosyl transferase